MGALAKAMRRDSRRYFERELQKVQGELRARRASLRALRRDLAEDGFYDATQDTRQRLEEALVHLNRAEGSVEEARVQLP